MQHVQAKRELKQVRNFIRAFKRNFEADWAATPSMNCLVGRIEIRIVKWNPNDHYCLIHVWDNKITDPTQENFRWEHEGSKWLWEWTGGRSIKWYESHIWDAVNEVAVNARNVD